MFAKPRDHIVPGCAQLLVVVASQLALIGCFPQWLPEYVGNEEENEDIREFVFRDTFSTMSESGKVSQTFCIDAGVATDKMILRLRDVGVQLKPKADCEVDREGARDKATNKRAIIFSVGRIRWITKEVVIVDRSMYSTPLSSNSARLKLKRTPSWHVEKVMMQMLS